MPFGVIDSILGNDAEDAAEVQAEATERGVAENRRQFDITNRQFAPYRAIGTPSLAALSSMMGIRPDTSEIDAEIAALEEQLAGLGQAQGQPSQPGPMLTGEAGTQFGAPDNAGGGFLGGPLREAFGATDASELERRLAQLRGMRDTLGQSYDFQESPGYQFRFDEGRRAAQNQLAASGNRLSGRALKELTRYGQGMASQEFGNQFNRLAGLAGVGQTAVGQTGQFGAQNAATISNLIGQGANATAAGQIAQGNSIRNLIGQGAMAYALA